MNGGEAATPAGKTPAGTATLDPELNRVLAQREQEDLKAARSGWSPDWSYTQLQEYSDKNINTLSRKERGELFNALHDACNRERVAASVDEREEPIPWQHPDYPDDRINGMVHAEICDVLNTLQRLPKGFDLTPADDLRDLLYRAVRDPAVRQLHEAQLLAREEQREREREGRRKIVINDQRLRDITDRALTSLIIANDPPLVFERARSLVRINKDENGLPVIEPLSRAGVRGVLERCCEFSRLRKDSQDIPIPPPMDMVDDLINIPDWGLPALRGIIECPALLTNGRILATAGYDADTRLYYTPTGGLSLQTIPEKPSRAEIKIAVEKIGEIFCDFPFVNDASRTNMVATLLTAVLRPMIQGPVPLVIIDKPQAGTGATLLSEIIALVATGRPAALMTAPQKEEEWKKAITSMLSAGRNLAIVDNVETKLYSSSLAAVITSNTWTDRRFGRNDEMITLPHSMVWIATGNNLQLGGDLPRRCYWVRLDAQSPRPWQRSEFKHQNLPSWIILHRAEIIAAILTLARAWLIAGKPEPAGNVPKMGSFEGWRETIGGILSFCEVSAFLGNLEEMYEQSDVDGPQWEAFFETWHSIWGIKPVTVAEITKKLHDCNDATQKTFAEESSILDTLPDILVDAWNGKKTFSNVLGKKLSQMNGRAFLSGLTLRKGKESHKVATWIVSPKQEKRGVS